MFRSSVEKTAHKLNNCIRTRLDRQQEYYLQSILGSPERSSPATFSTAPLYFALPRKDKSVSLAPLYTPSGNEDSESESCGSLVDDEADGEPDQFGFIQSRSGLYKHVSSNKEWKHHPYQI